MHYDQVAPEFKVRNGLRQGCVLAPTLFNIYFNQEIGQWREKCLEFGVNVLYKCAEKLVGERTRRLFSAKISELQFADYLAAVGMGRDSESMESAAQVLEDLLKEWGLTLSIVKIKLWFTARAAVLNCPAVLPLTTMVLGHRENE